jgi:hypothetical protein
MIYLGAVHGPVQEIQGYMLLTKAARQNAVTRYRVIYRCKRTLIGSYAHIWHQSDMDQIDRIDQVGDKGHDYSLISFMDVFLMSFSVGESKFLHPDPRMLNGRSWLFAELVG